MRCLVIGIGNPDRRDDGAGIAVAQALEALELPDVTIVPWPKDPSGLLDLDGWTTADCVVIVDATSTGAPPGTVRRIDTSHEQVTGLRSSGATHDLSVEDILALGQRLDRFPSQLTIFGIEGADFGHGTTLSPHVQDAVAQATVRIAVDSRLAISASG